MSLVWMDWIEAIHSLDCPFQNGKEDKFASFLFSKSVRAHLGKTSTFIWDKMWSLTKFFRTELKSKSLSESPLNKDWETKGQSFYTVEKTELPWFIALNDRPLTFRAYGLETRRNVGLRHFPGFGERNSGTFVEYLSIFIVPVHNFAFRNVQLRW